MTNSPGPMISSAECTTVSSPPGLLGLRAQPVDDWLPFDAQLLPLQASDIEDTAVTLPVGVECYAAYALRAWLASGHAISDRTRRFARWSAICSFALGMAGQVAFHLMDQDHVTRAPWTITTLVSCLPVLVLGMGTALAHMLREDAAATDHAQTNAPGPTTLVPPVWAPAEQPADQPDQNPPDRTATEDRPPGQTVALPLRDGR